MTTDQRDPFLQSLFEEAGPKLEGEAFSARVMARTRSFRLLMLAGGATLMLMMLSAAWLLFGVPLFEFAVLVSQALATPLFNLGEGWLALVLLPVNTIASALVITLKALRMLQKRLFGAMPYA
jgi:hypothetical protein